MINMDELIQLITYYGLPIGLSIYLIRWMTTKLNSSLDELKRSIKELKESLDKLREEIIRRS